MNPQRLMLIQSLKKKSIEENAGLWKRLARELEKPARSRRAVNLYHLEQSINEGDFVIVPGKVLGDGTLSKKATIAAFTFSESAKEKLKTCTLLSLDELLQKSPKVSEVKIIG